jgi:hypothetical protein
MRIGESDEERSEDSGRVVIASRTRITADLEEGIER